MPEIKGGSEKGVKSSWTYSPTTTVRQRRPHQHGGPEIPLSFSSFSIRNKPFFSELVTVQNRRHNPDGWPGSIQFLEASFTSSLYY